MGAEHIFHAKIGEDAYLISTSKDGPNEDGRSLLPGKATTNSYLVIGEERALLFDLAVNEAGVYEYAEKLAQKEVMLVLSHGHYDHVYHLNQREEVWLHKGDEVLLHEGMPFVGAPPVVPCPRLHYLKDGEQIELGNRVLKVIHIPGHTPGSILLLDEKTKILFSGDTGARRLLLGVSEDVDEEVLCSKLEGLKQEDFTVMYSAHDRCALPKEHIDLMISVMRREIDVDVENGIVPNVGDIITLNFGMENQLKFFNVASVKRTK